jgi:hypothetical protein
VAQAHQNNCSWASVGQRRLSRTATRTRFCSSISSSFQTTLKVSHAQAHGQQPDPKVRWVELFADSPCISPLRQCAIFSRNFKLICAVQFRTQKYSASRLTQITPTTPAIPSREEGRWPSSRTLGGGAVDAAASGARGVRRAVIRERTSRADERRLNASARSSVGWHLAG